MGVPGFFAWLMRQAERKHCKGGCILDEICEQHIDWLLLDTNGLLHPCCFKVLETHDTSGMSMMDIEDLMIEEVVAYVDKLINIVNPHKGVYIAIDGVAPASKMKQQRSRRFKSAGDRELFNSLKMKHGVAFDSEEWSNSCISPGTKFMERVHIRILEWAKTYNDTFPADWPPAEKRPQRQIIYSSYKTPMEGEHKLIQFMRDNNAKGLPSSGFNYVIYGMDADLIFLSIAVGNPKIFLLREAKQLKANGEARMDAYEFAFVSIDGIKSLIRMVTNQFYAQEVAANPPRAVAAAIADANASTDEEGFTKFGGGASVRAAEESFPDDIQENILRDFVLICFLLGNDFVPHLPALNIFTNGMETILGHYVRLIRKYECKRFLIVSQALLDSENIIDNDLFIELMLGLGEVENGILRDASKKKKRKPHCPFNDPYQIDKFRMENLDFPITDPVRLGQDSPMKWRERYYTYYGIPKGVDTSKYNEEIEKVCYQYLLGVKFIALYYFKDVPSWDWHYPFDYPPFLEDIQGFLRTERFNFSTIVFENSVPMKPFLQLLNILPPQYSYLLPKSLRHMMLDPLSQLAVMYPTTFPQDLIGKEKLYLAVPQLPRMNLDLIRAAYEREEKTVIDVAELKRNETESSFVFEAFP